MTEARLQRIPIASQQIVASEPKGSVFPGYPRPVREVHQIEITSRCNLRCKYCPHFPKLPRDMVDISDQTFYRAMEIVRYFVEKGTQTELALTGIGEPTLHKNLPLYIEYARHVLGWDRPITFSTNGIELTDELLDKIAPFRPVIYVSAHRPEIAAPAAIRAQRRGLLAGINTAFINSAFDWGGTVKWHVNAPETVCEFLRAGWCVILADGRITNCCVDPDGSGTFADVTTAPEKLMMTPIKLCSTCHMKVPEQGQIIG